MFAQTGITMTTEERQATLAQLTDDELMNEWARRSEQAIQEWLNSPEQLAAERALQEWLNSPEQLAAERALQQ
jgi:hypothetical protein